MKKQILTLLLAGCTLLSFDTGKPDIPRLGIVADIGQDSLIYASGFTMIGESVRRILAPSVNEADFKEKLRQIKAAKCKVISSNNFFPADLKIAGPDVDEQKVLDYAQIVMFRAHQVGIRFIVLGSGGARHLPDQYDVQQARSAFVKLAFKLGEIASENKITIVLENLERTETNFITSLKEAADIVRAVNHPNIRLNVDIFHMMRQLEPVSDIIAAKDIVGLAEIAETEKRTLPGVMKDDFKPYLRALRAINYKGYIFIEGSTKNPAAEIPQAYSYLSRQLQEVYAEKND